MVSSAHTNSRRYRKGEPLFTVGGSIDRIFVIQSGLVSLVAQRNGVQVELDQARAPQLIGEEALWGSSLWSMSAVAINDTEVLEINVRHAVSLMGAYPALAKVLTKSLIKKQQAVSQAVAAKKLETADTTPFPPESIPRLFAILYHAAISTGKTKEDRLSVVWPAYRKYCHWGLLESPVRLEKAVQILAKLGFAELEMVKSETDPEAPDELGFVHFKSVEHLRSFYRFYHQHHQQGVDTLIKTLGADEAPSSQVHLKILKEIQSINQAHRAAS